MISRNVFISLILLIYAIVVHTIDYLAMHGVVWLIHWGMFDWRMHDGFDLYKYFAWFVLPLAFSFNHLDFSYFSFRKWIKIDYVYLITFSLGSILIVQLIKIIPSLSASYESFILYGIGSRAGIVAFNLAWVLSWVVGWEFLHRYVLLNAFEKSWPRFGWLLVPILAGGYHLQKPVFEMAGMVIFLL